MQKVKYITHPNTALDISTSLFGNHILDTGQTYESKQYDQSSAKSA